MLIMVFAVNSATNTVSLANNQYPENLAGVLDNKEGKYTEEQQQEACKKLNAREYAAFGHLGGSGSSWGMRDQMKAYVKYVESLSPEEQQSDSYRGTLGSVKSMISQFDAYIRDNNIPDTRKGGGGKEKIPDSPIVEMLKTAEEALEKRAAKRAKAREAEKTADSTSVNVTLSTAALEILKASATGDKAVDTDGKAGPAPIKAALPDASAAGVGDEDKQTSGIVKLFNKGIDRLRKAVG
jgi:hypothetical protein